MEQNRPLVSIVVPVHNRMKAKVCAEHVKQQTYPRIELILVEFDGFPAEKRNFGYKQSKGEYILFLDEDEYLSPNAIKSCVAKFREGFEIVGIPMVKRKPHGYIENCVSLLKVNTPKYLFFNRLILDVINVFAIENVLCDDVDLYARAVSVGFKRCTITLKDGYMEHDETYSLRSILRKTVLVRKSYSRLLKKQAYEYPCLANRKRIFNEIHDWPILVGVLVLMTLLFVVRRIP